MPTVKTATRHRNSQNAIFIAMGLTWLVLMEFGFPLIDNTILRWSVTATVCIGML